MEIKFSDEQMQEILDGVVKNLTVAPRDTWSGRASPIQEAFNAAGREMAAGLAREFVTENAEFRERLRAVVATVAVEAIGKVEGVRKAVAEAMAGAGFKEGE